MTYSLKLDRPLVSLDLEATGLNTAQDRIIEISMIKIYPDSSERTILTHRINPQMPISPAATAVHGITNAHVANCPTFEQVAREIFLFLSECDITGFNVAFFDIPMLVSEFERLQMTFSLEGIRILDSHRIFVKQEPRHLSAAYQFYCNQTLNEAHSAQADAIAALEVLLAQVDRYPDLPKTPMALHEYCNPLRPDFLDKEGKLVWREGKVVMTFGKYRNQPVEHVIKEDMGYLQWVLKANFSPEVIKIIRDMIHGKIPKQPTAQTN